MVALVVFLSVFPAIIKSALAVNYPPVPDDLTTPFQQRLAIYGPNAVSVGWNTYATQSHNCVKYGTSPDSLDQQSCSAASTTYASSRTYSHTIILNGLTPATTYYYKIVSTNSTVDHFLSPRAPGDKTPFNLDVVIDLGVYGADGFTIAGRKARRDTVPFIEPELNHTTIGRLADTIDDYEFVIHPGDFAYADDWFVKPQNWLDGKDAYQAILEQFYDQLAPIAGRKAYMANPGNHEADCTEIPFTAGACPEGQRNFTDFMHRFSNSMPATFPSSSSNATARSLATKANNLANPPFWYSFEYGMVHIAMIDTETDFANAPDGANGSAHLQSGDFGYLGQQQDFLEADLASVDRTVTPWVIVAGHRPWYTTGPGTCSACRDAFESIFYRYGVDLGVFGHEHNSQRFLPVVNNTADPNGMTDPQAPLYIVAGGAGNIEGLSSVGSKPSYTEFAYADDYSYSTLRVLDENHLQIDFIRSSTGDLLDTSTLYKSHSSAFVVQ